MHRRQANETRKTSRRLVLRTSQFPMIQCVAYGPTYGPPYGPAYGPRAASWEILAV
jgi:hypothetical protein